MRARPIPDTRLNEVLLGTADSAVRVLCNDPEAAALVRRCYSPYCVTTGRLGSSQQFGFERLDEGWAVSGPEGAANSAHPGSWAAIADLEYRITLALLDSLPSLVHLHAAGLVYGGRAALAIGGSGAGKSTLAASWCLQGQSVLGDDTVFLNEGAVVAPFKRLFKLNPDEIARRGLEPRQTPFWEEGVEEVWFDPEGLGGWSEEVPLGLVVLLERDAEAGESVEDIARGEALNLLQASLMPTGLHGAPAFERLLEAVQQARTVKITCGDVGYVADSVQRLLG